MGIVSILLNFIYLPAVKVPWKTTCFIKLSGQLPGST